MLLRCGGGIQEGQLQKSHSNAGGWQQGRGPGCCLPRPAASREPEHKVSRLVALLPTADHDSHGCIVGALSPQVYERHTWNASLDKLDGVISCSAVEESPLYRSVALHRHLDTLRLLALALGPLLQQFISDTRLHQDTSVFVDAGVAQSMLSGEQQESAEDCADSCEAEFQQYDLGSYRGVRGPMQLATLTIPHQEARPCHACRGTSSCAALSVVPCLAGTCRSDILGAEKAALCTSSLMQCGEPCIHPGCVTSTVLSSNVLVQNFQRMSSSGVPVNGNARTVALLWSMTPMTWQTCGIAHPWCVAKHSPPVCLTK